MASTSSIPRWSSLGKAACPRPPPPLSTWPMKSSSSPPSTPSTYLSSVLRSLCAQGHRDLGYAQCTRGQCSCLPKETSSPLTQMAFPTYSSVPAVSSLEPSLCRKIQRENIGFKAFSPSCLHPDYFKGHDTSPLTIPTVLSLPCSHHLELPKEESRHPRTPSLNHPSALLDARRPAEVFNLPSDSSSELCSALPTQGLRPGHGGEQTHWELGWTSGGRKRGLFMKRKN